MPIVSLGLVSIADAEQAAEAVWLGSLTMIERAIADAREGRHGRWHSYPRADLRRLRRDLAQAMTLARIACRMREAADELEPADDMAEALTSVARTRRNGQQARDAAIRANVAARRERAGLSDGAATVGDVTG